MPSAVCRTWLSSIEVSLRRRSDRDAERTIAFGRSESGGISSLRMPGRWEEMAIAPGVGVALAGHEWVQYPPYLAAVSPCMPPLSLFLPLPMLGRQLGRRFQHLLLLVTLLIGELDRVHALPPGVQHPRQSGQSPLGCLLLRLHKRCGTTCMCGDCGSNPSFRHDCPQSFGSVRSIQIPGGTAARSGRISELHQGLSASASPPSTPH